jgi:hypothetical protein
MSKWQEAKLANLCVEKSLQTRSYGSQLHQKNYVTVGMPIDTVELMITE